MVKMADVERIRWLALREGWSIRRIAKEMGLNRRTVAKWLARPEVPVYQREGERPKPALGEFEHYIEQWLCADEHRPPKQRHTARRIYQRLCEEYDYQGSESTVRRHVARLKNKPAEAFVPLEFDPAEAQADFGEAVVILAGVQVVVQFFCLRLCHSGMPFVMAFPHQRQEAFFEGIRRAFEALGGAPVRVIFDNLKQAVQKILEGKNRVEQEAFRCLRTHYLFESSFCNPASGNEKGSVENLVGFVKRNFFTPLPEIASYEELNQILWQRCQEYAKRTRRGQSQAVAELWAQERTTALRSLPPVPFDCSRTVKVGATRTSLVPFETNHYSVPVRFAGTKNLTLRAYVDRVEVYAGLTCIARHGRSYERERDVLELDHYLELLERKPGALRNAKPLRAAKLPPIYHQYWGELRLHHPKGDREFVRILMLHREFPPAQVEAALTEASRLRAFHHEAVQQILLKQAAPAAPLDRDKYSRLPDVAVEKPLLTRYNQLTGGTVH